MRFQAGQNQICPGLSSPISRSHCCQSTKGPDGMVVDIWTSIGNLGTNTIGISLSDDVNVALEPLLPLLLLLPLPLPLEWEERTSNSFSAWEIEDICFCINLECCIFVFIFTIDSDIHVHCRKYVLYNSFQYACNTFSFLCEKKNQLPIEIM